MFVRRRNFYLLMGKEWERGHDCYVILLAWGLREIIEGRKPPPGEHIFADQRAIRWRWPPCGKRRRRNY